MATDLMHEWVARIVAARNEAHEQGIIRAIEQGLPSVRLPNPWGGYEEYQIAPTRLHGGREANG